MFRSSAPLFTNLCPPQLSLDQTSPLILKTMILLVSFTMKNMGLMQPKKNISPSAPATAGSDRAAPSAQMLKYENIWPRRSRFDLRVYISTNETLDYDALKEEMTQHAQSEGIGSPRTTMALWDMEDVVYADDVAEIAANVTVPPPLFQHMLANGSAYAHAYFVRSISRHQFVLWDVPAMRQRNPSDVFVSPPIQLNAYKPKPKLNARKNLLSGEYSDERVQSLEDLTSEKKKENDEIRVSFWKPRLSLRLVTDHSRYGGKQLPPLLAEYGELDHERNLYYPVVYVDNFWSLQSSHHEINDTMTGLSLQVSYSPISLLKWHLQASMEKSWENQAKVGMGAGGTVIVHVCMHVCTHVRVYVYIDGGRKGGRDAI